ncbi:MAG: universal stress protein [Desulfobacteraceae bacterium]|nr:MAG: universal stress protein [Desulfobacteraceae bacterium]
MEIRKILFTTDLENQPSSLDLVKQILPLQELGLEHMFFLQNSRFDTRLEGLSQSQVEGRIIVDEELSLSRILKVAEEEDVSLIVTNLSKHKARAAGGLIIKKLIRGASRPILFANNTIDQMAEPDEKGLFGHIVFATDWSLESEKALSYLLGLKRLLGELEIVNVIDRKLTIRDMRELKERLAQTRKKFLDEKIDAESHIYAGKTSEEIFTAAKDYKATMIVIGGDSEKKGIKGLFKKGSSYKIPNEAALPVLVVT